jgi:hypothetical protein
VNLDEWYVKFHRMSRDIFSGAPDEARRARDFYLTIVGNEAIVDLTVALRLDLTEGGQDWALEVADRDRVAEFRDYLATLPPDSALREPLQELINASTADA